MAEKKKAIILKVGFQVPNFESILGQSASYR